MRICKRKNNVFRSEKKHVFLCIFCKIVFCCLIIISTSFNRINMFDINRWCTFSDNECQFTFGRRWQIAQLEDDNEDLGKSV